MREGSDQVQLIHCQQLVSFDNDMRAIGEERHQLAKDGSKMRLSAAGLVLLKKSLELVDSGEFDKLIVAFKEKNAHLAPRSREGKAVRSYLQGYERQADRCRKLAVDFRLPMVEPVST